MATNDVVYGLDNSRLRSFLPSTANTFGGFPVPYVMLDSGCNTHLLSIPNEGLLTLFETFPTMVPNDAGETFTYTIRGGGGVVALQSPVLCISNNSAKGFIVQLCSDLYPYQFVHNDDLRVSLCYDDAVGLMAAHNSSTIVLRNSQRLRGFVDVINTLRTHHPGIEVGTRRRHALLGRSLIRAGRKMFHVNGLTIISANNARVSPTDAEAADIFSHCTTFVSENQGMEHFNDLEDDYSDELPVDLEPIDS
eukprot:gene11520-13442_t